jgi:Fe-S-cluster containining protein
VPVSGYDVWRISRSLGIEPSDFVVAYPGQAVAEFGFELHAGGDRFELALEKHGPFQLGEPCVFLERQADGTSHCGIYAARPSVCRAYPMEAQAGDAIALRPRALCPPGAWPDGESQQPHWRDRWDSMHGQFEQYRQIVRAWNAQVALHAGRTFGMDHYLAYLLGVYDKLGSSATISVP